jgi:phosphoribosylformylglycinamidine (FGAM) synthase PurS component
MQRAFPSEALERKLDTVRKPLGEVVSRKLKSAKFGKSVQQVSGGDYFKLRFNTSFSNRQHAVETVTPVLQKDGTWKVSGYYVDRSRAGITNSACQISNCEVHILFRFKKSRFK